MDGRPPRRIDRFDWLIIAVCILIYVALIMVSMSAKPFGDKDFHFETKIITDVVKGIEPGSSIYINKAPFPDIFYSIPYMLVPAKSADGIYWIIGTVWNGLWMIFSMLAVRRIGRKLHSDRAGLLAVGLMLVLPLHIYYGLSIAAEPPAFYASVFMLLGWANWRARDFATPLKDKGWWLMTICLLILIFSRPNAILVPMVLLAACAANRLFSRHTASLSNKLSLRGNAIAAVSVLIVGFFLLELVKPLNDASKGRVQMNQLMYVAHQGRFQFRQDPLDWRNSEKENRGDGRDWQAWDSSKNALNRRVKAGEASYIELYKNWLIQDALSHPVWYLRSAVMKTLFGHVLVINSKKPGQFQLGPLKGKTAYYLFHFAVNLLGLAVLFFAMCFLHTRRKQLIAIWPLWMPWVALIIFHAATYMEPRYMFPARAAIFLMGAVFFVEYIGQRTTARRQQLKPANH